VLPISLSLPALAQEYSTEDIRDRHAVAYPLSRLQRDWNYQDHGLKHGECFVAAEDGKVEHGMVRRVLAELKSPNVAVEALEKSLALLVDYRPIRNLEIYGRTKWRLTRRSYGESTKGRPGRAFSESYINLTGFGHNASIPLVGTGGKAEARRDSTDLACFGNQSLYCLDGEGNLRWSRRLEPRPTRNGWGTASSPVLHGDRLHVVNDNDEESYLLCLDKRTGKDVWRVVRDQKSNWATPFIWQNDRRTEIVTPGTGKVRSCDLEGKLLWWFTGRSSLTIGTPYPAFFAKCDALPVPGADGKIVSVFSPAFGRRENAGNVMLVDVKAGPGEWSAARQISPEAPDLGWSIGSGQGARDFAIPIHATFSRFGTGDYHVRWMQRFGVLPESVGPATDRVDPYETDRAYWRSLWHQPAAVRTASAAGQDR
jgi:hypothetical protein